MLRDTEGSTEALAACRPLRAEYTSSSHLQTPPARPFQLNTLPRRAVRDQATASLPTLTCRKDKIAFGKQWKVTDLSN